MVPKVQTLGAPSRATLTVIEPSFTRPKRCPGAVAKTSKVLQDGNGQPPKRKLADHMGLLVYYRMQMLVCFADLMFAPLETIYQALEKHHETDRKRPIPRKKRSIWTLNEHFEEEFNTIGPNAIVFFKLPAKRHCAYLTN